MVLIPLGSFTIASNETERGRELNRRVEVEFWYDDPLQELDDDLQICPESLGDMVKSSTGLAFYFPSSMSQMRRDIATLSTF